MKTVILSIVLMISGWSLSAFAEDPEHVIQGKQGIKAFSEGNLIEAMELLGKSAEQGYAPAQATLAYILDKSDDDAEAFRLYREAARQGDAAGQYGLAGMYAKGEGTEKNPQLAGEWMQKSANQQYLLAMRDYATALERGGLGFPPSPVEALEWYRKCSDAGDGVCTRRLAKAYRKGELGLPVDPKKSTELFDQINKKPDEK